MWEVGKEDGDGFPPPFSRGQALRGNNGVVRWNNGWVGGMGGSRTAPTGENVVGHGVHPHPNLPPSRGKGFVAAEREIFIVMTSGKGMTGEEGALRRNAGEMMWMGSRLRFHEGRLFAGTTEGGMGPRPPSSRGQDLDARTRRGRAARFLGSASLHSV